MGYTANHVILLYPALHTREVQLKIFHALQYGKPEKIQKM